MRIASLLFAGLVLGACGTPERRQTPNAGEQYSAEQIREGLPGITDACIERLQSDDSKAPPTDQCFEMQGPRRWRGLWRNVFEGSRFCPEPAPECGHDTPGERIWLSFGEQLPQSKLDEFGGLYELDLVGRRTLHRGRHGQFGSYDHALIVERVISVREVEPPPPAATAQDKAWEKQCEASPDCFTNNELKAFGWNKK